jgi:hypothetical protein
MIEDILDLVRVRLDVPEDRWLFGADKLANLRAPPSYVWVPMTDRFGPPSKASSGPSAHPKHLFTRRAGLECHIWGADTDTTETLLHGVVAALFKVVDRTELELGSAQWNRAEVNQRGELVVLTVGIPIPVTDADLTNAIRTKATLIACDNTDSDPEDGVLECCED